MIWGLDIATRCTGITAGTGADKPAVGVWNYDFCGDDLGVLLEKFVADLNELAARRPPTYVIYEAPILTPRDRLLPLRKTYSMGGQLEVWARARGIEYREENLKVLKKALTGRHDASKDQMVAAVRRLGIPLPAGEAAKDAADSFAAWYVGLRYHAKQHLTAWDQALYTHRGFAL